MINLKNKRPNILVIGDLMIDHYLWGSCEKISPEAPVQIVNINSENILLGGAGNVINNLKKLGAKVDVISVLGECKISQDIGQLLRSIDVDTQYLITQKDRLASKKSRIVASQQQVVRFDRESKEAISKISETKILDFFNKIVSNYECILLSDYGKGVLTRKLTQSLIKIANNHNKKILVDPKGEDFSKYKNAYLLTPNKKEASAATQIKITSKETLEQAIIKLKSKCNLAVSLITLSEDGIALLDEKLIIHPTVAIEVFDVTGAGDTILASLGFALGCNYSINDAVKFANLAAGIVVGKVGSATASLNEIIEYEANFHPISNESQIKNLDEITTIAKELKDKDKKIIFTNGCFDILHAGHVKYLEQSKNLGDILIIGLNSNHSVSLLKGDQRPINDEMDRAIILSSLKSVDYVVIFDEDTPYNLIKAIKPHILVKGGDYKGKRVVGDDIANELKYINFIKNKSTTKLIEKIKQSN
jgi:D-beta-D-heptose 7-phosphate kinase / D-beta-D-heptose 1-phosphate adenosyltransferase